MSIFWAFSFNYAFASGLDDWETSGEKIAEVNRDLTIVRCFENKGMSSVFFRTDRSPSTVTFLNGSSRVKFPGKFQNLNSVSIASSRKRVAYFTPNSVLRIAQVSKGKLRVERDVKTNVGLHETHGVANNGDVVWSDKNGIWRTSNSTGVSELIESQFGAVDVCRTGNDLKHLLVFRAATDKNYVSQIDQDHVMKALGTKNHPLQSFRGLVGSGGCYDRVTHADFYTEKKLAYAFVKQPKFAESHCPLSPAVLAWSDTSILGTIRLPGIERCLLLRSLGDSILGVFTGTSTTNKDQSVTRIIQWSCSRDSGLEVANERVIADEAIDSGFSKEESVLAIVDSENQLFWNHLDAVWDKGK